MLGSYKINLLGVEFVPHSFRGHGWLYSHVPKDSSEEKSLIDAGAFKLPAEQKKNTGTIILRSNTRARKPPTKRKCCGNR